MERTWRASRVAGVILPGIPSSLPLSGSADVLGQNPPPPHPPPLFLSLQPGLHLSDCCQHPSTFQTLPSTAPSPDVPSPQPESLQPAALSSGLAT